MNSGNECRFGCHIGNILYTFIMNSSGQILKSGSRKVYTSRNYLNYSLAIFSTKDMPMEMVQENAK